MQNATKRQVNQNYIYFLLIQRSISISVCVQQRISLTDGSIWYSFSVKPILGLGKIYNYFGEGCLYLSNINFILLLLFKLKFYVEGRLISLHLLSMRERVGTISHQSFIITFSYSLAH